MSIDVSFFPSDHFLVRSNDMFKVVWFWVRIKFNKRHSSLNQSHNGSRLLYELCSIRFWQQFRFLGLGSLLIGKALCFCFLFFNQYLMPILRFFSSMFSYKVFGRVFLIITRFWFVRPLGYILIKYIYICFSGQY